MRAPLALIDDLSQRSDDQPKTVDAVPYRRPGYWIWLGCIVFCIAFWTGAGFGIRELIAVL
jgi:hypothetical protein